MSRTASGPSTPIVLKLDLADPFEALVLNEARRRPTERQEAWLRHLLVQGFKSECGALQMLQRDRDLPSRHRAPIAREPAGPALAIVQESPAVAAPPPSADQPRGETRTVTSFAALQKVIG